MRTLLRLTLIILIFVAVYAAGFLYFVVTLPKAPPKAPRADGIVALTGGTARLDAAVQLLESRAARRLLITGVFETTTKDDLAKRVHAGTRFDCCADVDYTAEDTHDNAEQASEWARMHGYHSLIVVTTRYHMPRSLAEFSAAMPAVNLVPYPVEPPSVNLRGWWAKPRTLRLLHGEYVKYLATLIMTSLHGNRTPDTPAPRRPPSDQTS